MAPVTIYGRSTCGFCMMARQLCERQDLEYRYIDIEQEGLTKADLADIVGKPVFTVPQILVGSRHVGGFDDFSAFLAEKA